jgi:hypothetical protein
VIYNVSFDLAPLQRPPGRVIIRRGSLVHPFYQELKGSRSWWHYLDNTWLISTDESLAQLDQRLRQHLGPTDKLLIVKFHGEYAGTLPDEAWQWIEERMSLGELVR